MGKSPPSILTWSLTCLWVCVQCLTLCAQEETHPVLRVRSEAVLLDLLVADGDGNFIDDLRPEEVHIREDGQTQRIEFFELQRAATSDEVNADGGASGYLRDRSYRAPGRSQPLVFLLDLESIDQNDLVRVKQSIAQFVAEHSDDGARFMLATVSTTLRVVEDFTSDPAELLGALERVRVAGRPNRMKLTGVLDSMESVFASFASNKDNFLLLLEAARIATTRGVTFLTRLENQVHQTTSGISLLATSLRPLAGRKQVIFYSGGYHMDPSDSIRSLIQLRLESLLSGRLRANQKAQLDALLGSLQRPDCQGFLRDAIAAANRSQVSVYSVDARGLQAPAFDPSQTSSAGGRVAILGRRASYDSADSFHTQDFLVGLSSATGGVAYLNNNDLSRGARRAYLDGREYYLLAYSPVGKRVKGKYHRISVSVDRKGSRVRYRSGYLDLSKDELVRRDVINALNFPALFPDEGIRLETDREGDTLRVKTLIPTQALSFSQDGEKLSCPVETYGILVDRRGRWLENRPVFAKSHRVLLEPGNLEKLRSVDYVSTTSNVAAPVGKYKLVVVVRQGRSSQIGAASEEIEIKPRQK